MLLTHEKLKEAIQLGKIRFEPYNEDQISINSIDVRIGFDLWEMVTTDQPFRDIYCPTEKNWKPIQTILASEVRAVMPSWALGVIPDNCPVFLLEPGKFYLATTLEKIGTIYQSDEEVQIIPRMAAKSTTGRQGLTVAICAGVGELHFHSRWALEVRVVDAGIVPIAVGTWLGQVTFEEGYNTDQIYDGPDRYQNKEEVRFLPKPIKWTDPTK